MDSSDTGTELLRQLLDCRRGGEGAAPLDLLDRLLLVAPLPEEIKRRRTLFDVLELSATETAHSAYLAWLLDPDGPLTGAWLLRLLFEKALPDRPWPGAPRRVEAEVASGGERPDIVAFWDRFTFVIEYKIDSPETAKQICRYLATFGVDCADLGAVLYVTKYGSWPTSVPPGDPRVRVVSYEELIGLIDAGLRDGLEPQEKGRVLVSQYRDCLARAINRRFMMEKPTFSEGTKLLLLHHQRFEALRQNAIAESMEFVAWLSREAAKRLRPILGEDMEWDEHWEVKSYIEFIYRRPQWRVRGVEFGFGFGTERDAMLSASNLWLGVVLPYPDAEKDVATRQDLSEQLRKRLRDDWPFSRIEPPEEEWPLWQALQFDGSDDPYRWGEDVLSKLATLATELTAQLDKFAPATPPAVKGTGRRGS